MSFTLFCGNCLDVVRSLPPVAVILTDPPYGIKFQSGWTGAKIAGDESTAVRDSLLAALPGVPALVFGSMAAPAPAGTRATLIWHKPGAGMGDLSFPFKPDYELIHVIGKGFSYPRRGSSVLSFTWDTFRGEAAHPHQKPVDLLAYLLQRCPPGPVFDGFMGSGSVGVAAVQAGRDFIGCEIDQGYFEVAKRRIEAAAQQPLLVS
jgi:DNA modification methylase